MIKFFTATYACLLLAGTSLLAQNAADSLLPEAVITAYGVQTPDRTVPAAVSTLNAQDFYRTGEATPVLAFQQLPGVRLEERSPGSYRVSIRGSSLRSPFGVRNVKVYLNNIPITEANGSTQLNLFDIALYQQVEVIRGPAASYYGAGTGGVINIGSLPVGDTGGGQPEAELSAGSYGYFRVKAAYQKGDSLNRLRAGVTHMQTSGYREHSSLERQNVFWSNSFRISPKREFQATLLLARIKYDIPGGLNAEQFADNPRQARPGNDFVGGSVAQNSSINQHYALLGAGQHYQFSKKLENSSWVFGSGSFLNHPFITDYKRDLATGFGTRSIWKYSEDWGNVAMNLQFGSEMQLGFEVARNYGNRGGQVDTLNFEDEITSRIALYFLQADFELMQRWSLTAGLSFNNYSYDIKRLVDAERNSPYQLDKTFDPVWAPRIAMAYELADGLQLYGQISKGFSPPSLEEIRTNEGSLNEDLEAERGTNYEAGLKGKSGNGIIDWSLTAYYFSLNQTITSYIAEGSPVTRFRNSGSARQTGLEAALHWRMLQTQKWLVKSSLSGAYQHYRFENYQQQDEDFSGNALPGVAPLTSALTIDLLYRQRVGLYLTHTYTDDIPLNDANSFYADSYHLVQARLEYILDLSRDLDLRFFISGQNLLNERYSLGYDLNAFGNRFFQPAPERSFFVGVTLHP
jgi:iron complex outermembrane receptor protein